MRSKENFLYSLFLFCDLNSRYDELRNISDSHSSRGSLPKNLLSQLNIVAPDKIILKKFNKIMNPMFTRIEKNMKFLSTLTHTRDSLLPKLMSGEIRV